MTDQPKPDKQPEADAAQSTASSAPESVQEEKATVSSQPPSAPATPKDEPAPPPPAPVIASSDGDKPATDAPKPAATVTDPPKPPVNSETSPVSPAPAVPAASATSNSSSTDPTQPSKERQSTLDLSDPRFKEVAKPISGTEDAKPGEPKSTQRLPDPSSLGVGATPAPAANICPTCGHRNRPGVLLCDNCGTNLMTGGKASIGTRDLKKEDAKAGAAENLLDTSQRKAVDTAGGSIFTEDMVLRIEIEGGSTPMLVYPKQEIIMGRRDPNTGGMPDVDLTTYAGYRMGVSRRHAAIRLQEQHLHVSDLGSSNGTFLNGTRLNAHRPYQLRDGDEVRLGQMVLRVFYQTSKDRK